jgi:hypothetical protein
MTRPRGRAPVGQRLVQKVSAGHWKTTTLIASLGIEGIRCSTVVDGAVSGDVFEAFVEQVLVPELRDGDVVVMDNLLEPQAGADQGVDRGGRRGGAVPAAVLAGLEPDRDDLREGQAPAALAGLPHARGVVERDAVGAGSGQRLRRRQLLPTLRLHATNEVRML